MKTIDVKKIIEDMGCDKKTMAKQLFPGNKFPVLALDRVLQDKAVLDANQISRLSSFSGVPIGKLFDEWEITQRKGVHTLKNGNYHAEVDFSEMVIRMYHNASLFHEEILFDSKLTLSELIDTINIQIKNYESN